jgi:addiction module HigA family antidote
VAVNTFKCADTEALLVLRRVARFANIERPARERSVPYLLSLEGKRTRRLRDRGPSPRQIGMSRRLQPAAPGEMLAEEFPKPLGMSNCRLAKEIGVPAQRIGESLAGKCAITADTDFRLCRFFGLSDGLWLRLQADYDTEVAKASLAKTLAKIRPWKQATERTAETY